MFEVNSIKSNRLSWFRTEHEFRHFAEIENRDDFFKAENYAKEKGLPKFFLGNGSNVFFAKKKIETLVLKNSIPKTIEPLGNDEFKISSSFSLSRLLKSLLEESRDAPYNLASVPATVGGALAMNAGTGRKGDRFLGQFLKRVEVWKEGEVFELSVSELDLSFRESIFSEKDSGFIATCVFCFPKVEIEGNPIKERIAWAREHQELGVPNCGSTFRKSSGPLLRFTQKVFVKCPAYISSKSIIWVSNRSSSSLWLRSLFFFVKFLHRLCFKRLEFEVRIVK